MILTIIEIFSICLFAWYVNTFVINGADKQLIFVKTISLILCVSIFSIIIFKIAYPKEVNNKNIELILGLVRDMTFIVIGYLFTKKEEK